MKLTERYCVVLQTLRHAAGDRSDASRVTRRNRDGHTLLSSR